MPKRAQEAFSGTGNFTKKFSGDRDDLYLINDGAADLTFTAGVFTFTVKPGEYFNEEVNYFNSINITTTSSFRGYVREGY